MKPINFIILFFASALIILSACNKDIYSDYSSLSAKQKQALIATIKADPIYQKDIAAQELLQGEGLLRKVDFSKYNGDIYLKSVQTKSMGEALKDAGVIATPEYIEAMTTSLSSFRELIKKYPAISKFSFAEMKELIADELTKNYEINIRPRLAGVYSKPGSN